MRIFIEGRGRKRNVEVGGGERGREGACFADEATGGGGGLGIEGGAAGYGSRKDGLVRYGS